MNNHKSGSTEAKLENLKDSIQFVLDELLSTQKRLSALEKNVEVHLEES